MTDSPVTLITGGSGGIGAAAAEVLLDKGHRVTVTGRDEGRLDRFVKDRGEPAGLLAVQGHAADPDAVRRAVDATVDTFGRLDNIVANAGFAVHDGLAGDPAGWPDMVLTNVLGPALLIHAALPHVSAARGRIVLVGSVGGVKNLPGNLYGATKWAITGLAENVRMMVTGDGVGVTLIAPGRVATAFWDNHADGPPDGDLMTAEQVAGAIAWTLDQPHPVDVNTIVLRPIGQPH